MDELIKKEIDIENALQIQKGWSFLLNELNNFEFQASEDTSIIFSSIDENDDKVFHYLINEGSLEYKATFDNEDDSSHFSRPLNEIQIAQINNSLIKIESEKNKTVQKKLLNDVKSMMQSLLNDTSQFLLTDREMIESFKNHERISVETEGSFRLISIDTEDILGSTNPSIQFVQNIANNKTDSTIKKNSDFSHVLTLDNQMTATESSM